MALNRRSHGSTESRPTGGWGIFWEIGDAGERVPIGDEMDFLGERHQVRKRMDSRLKRVTATVTARAA